MDEQAINSGKNPYDWSSLVDTYNDDGSLKQYGIYDTAGNLIDTDWVNQMFKSNAKTESYNVGVTGGVANSGT
jgi:hypothetical protein